MRERYKYSLDWLERARRVTPGGAQTRSKMASQFTEGAFPVFLDKAEGPYVWDVDEHKYLDLIMGLGAVGLGHGAVTLAVPPTPSFSLPHPIEVEYAEWLCDVIPCAEMVRFVKTGSEATEGAMRIARAFTGREEIISIGYHGWHSAHDAGQVSPIYYNGVPSEYYSVHQKFPYNDLKAVSDLLEQGTTAGILLEPVLHERPQEGYLQGLRQACSKTETLLIFDEVITGFRWALAGAQEFYGVTPDLATFGKAMANGWPLACVVGRRDVMEAGGRYVSGTFGGEIYSLAAGMATLTMYLTPDDHGRKPLDLMHHAGAMLQIGFNEAARRVDVPYEMLGFPCKPYVRVTEPDPAKHRISLLLQEAALRGVLLHPTSLCVSAAHTREVIMDGVKALEEAFKAIKGGVELQGMPSRPAFQRIT